MKCDNKMHEAIAWKPKNSNTNYNLHKIFRKQ